MRRATGCAGALVRVRVSYPQPYPTPTPTPTPNPNPGVQEHHASASASAANVVCPNVLELGIMTDTDPRNPAEVLSAARKLLDKGPSLVLVKHLAHAGLDPDKVFEMLL